MFPDLVKISWKMEDANGRTVEVPKAETEVLEQRKEGQTTNKPTEAPPTTMAAPTCLFRNDTQEPLTLHLTDDSFQSTFSLNLAFLVYTAMIVKSMVYCCGISVLLHHRSLGRGPSTCRHIH
ncbi:hypothetical protein J4Q44_G00236230 [Coregonus suidteri]|uniref:Uncharacterized protein n=1 Tax=Coregonus suidteri TaxID=861788 RepID=A0AAN8LBI1_9TELE